MTQVRIHYKTREGRENLFRDSYDGFCAFHYGKGKDRYVMLMFAEPKPSPVILFFRKGNPEGILFGDDSFVKEAEQRFSKIGISLERKLEVKNGR